MMDVATLHLPSTPDVTTVTAVLNYAAKYGALQMRFPVWESDSQIRHLTTTLQNGVLPSISVVPNEPIFVSIDVMLEDGHIVLGANPNGRWPAVFVPTRWAEVRTAPRQTKASYERWLDAALNARPRWEIASHLHQAPHTVLGNAFQTGVIAPFEYVQFPGESIAVEYKVLDLKKPLSAAAFVRRVHDYLLPFLRSTTPFTICFGVNDKHMAPKGVVLEDQVHHFLLDAKNALVSWMAGLWPPLDVEEVRLDASPAPVLEGPLQLWKTTKFDKAVRHTNKRPVEAFELFCESDSLSESDYCQIFTPGGRDDATNHLTRIRRYVLHLSVTWRTVDANPILVHQSEVEWAPRLVPSSEGLADRELRQSALDLWLSVHDHPTDEAKDFLCNPMTEVVVIAHGGATPRLLAGCEPAATYDTLIPDQKTRLVAQMEYLAEKGQPLAILAVVPEKDVDAALVAKGLGSCLSSNVRMFLQADEGRPAQTFLRALDTHFHVVDIFRTPRAPPSFTCAMQQAGLRKHTAATSSLHELPAEVPLEAASSWIEGQCDLPMEVIGASLAHPLNSQAASVSRWICEVARASPPRVETLLVVKLFLCCGSTTLLRIAVATALQQCPELVFWDGDAHEVVTSDLLASVTEPTIFILEAASEDNLEALRSVKVPHSVAILSSARWRSTSSGLRDLFVCSPFVDPANIPRLCSSLAQIYPEKTEVLRNVQRLSTSADQLELRHILVFVLAALRTPLDQTVLRSGVSGFVADDLNEVNAKSRPLLFALAFVGYFAEAPGRRYIPLDEKRIRGFSRLLRRGSLLRRVSDSVGFWHPWIARLVLEQMRYAESWLHVLDKGLIDTLVTLDDVDSSISRPLLRQLLTAQLSDGFGFSKLVTCYRTAVGANRKVTDHFPNVQDLLAFLGPRPSDDAKNSFQSAMQVLLSRLHRLHCLPDHHTAVEYAKAAVKISSTFDAEHNLAVATIEPNPRRGLELLLQLKTAKKKEKGKVRNANLSQLSLLNDTAREAIKKLPLQERRAQLDKWGLASAEPVEKPNARQMSRISAPTLSASELHRLLDAAKNIA